MAVDVDLSPLRRLRRDRGLTQADLAARAGVSRQLVAAAESGQNVPAVDAAIRLARALSTTVEELFAPPRDSVRPALPEPLPEGAAIRVGRVGEQLVATVLPDHGTSGSGWAAADGVVVAGRPRLFPGASGDGLVLAGCDPALALADGLLAGRGASSLLHVSAPTGAALRALAGRTVHAAAVHGPATALPAPPVTVDRIHLAQWQIGLALSPRRRARGLADALAAESSIVQRDPAAAAQQALVRAAAAAGLALPPGPRAGGHIDAARRARLLDCPAVTTEAAARAFGLAFLPLEAHTVEIWLDVTWRAHPAVEALGNVLAAEAFTGRIAAVGGYDLTNCGRYLAAA